ncbi:UvrD-helicase domain-containing protein [Patescibacteria group bacterium]|nr:UvrD-helicase domain-containing protein [Patescibacteria group bacterium]MBU1500633.1 UvrD-helicase domain-containing protein [Patescibacteria group bacterium]MBU2080524.1 UvrD-helicase domain-containing protein [Patescibacteria group bacterium]MBU2123671.1 UvrD-helicase domain-containing protein [Patescibacteria group bacterium]MBU2194527.1 UvrD-helicase domain-containing protein [Patescibacteria group bacterium]
MQHLDGLNHAQKEAVLATEGPISVLAGAGSGKTRVLTTRIYHLIKSGVPADRILAVTFTNKAAREMRERLSHQLSGGTLPLVVTFHGLGRELLERYGTRIGVPRYFSIFDRDDSKAAIKRVLKEMDIDSKELSPGYVLSRISKEKGEGRTADMFREKHGRTSFQARVVADVWPRYEEIVRKEKALDFDDLISLPVRLLTEHDDIRTQAEQLFSYIHVDEYQDTNKLQGRLAGYLSAIHQNLFVVGDIDQTIYTWRGATIENLLEFEERYPTAQTIVLAHNYRSTKTIVTAANQIIEKNQNRKDKHAVTDNADGEQIRLHLARNAEAEARWVAREVRTAIRAGTSPEEIAVLFRTNFQSRTLEEAFLSEGIPYKVLGTRFLDRKEVKDVLAWVRLSLEPSREADFMRAVQVPSRGIGKVTIGKLLSGNREALRPGERAKVEAFEAVVQSLHEAAKTAIPSAFVKLVIEKSGMETALAQGGEEDQERLENAKELASLASRFDSLSGEEGLSAFLAESALAGDQDEIDRDPAKTGVTLMTVHAAKGLEFDTVFVTGLEEGLFPHQGYDEEKRDEEEERRLFYVAVTRAKRRLSLTMAHVRRIYGTDFASEPSSFIGDIDEGLIAFSEGEDFYGERIIHI